MGQEQSGCSGRSSWSYWSWFDSIETVELQPCSSPPEDVVKPDAHKSGVITLSADSAMDALQSELIQMMLQQRPEDKKSPSKSGIVDALHKLQDLRDELGQLDTHGGSVVEALVKLLDLRNELSRLKTENGILHETNAQMQRCRAGSEEWGKFDVLVEHYREVEQHRRACQISSMSDGSTATSDADSSAGSDLASEDLSDATHSARFMSYHTTVGTGSNDSTARMALPLKESCAFFKMTPRSPVLEVLDCYMTPRYNISLEVLDCRMTPRCKDSLELID